jgi:hypothetical protein
MRLTLISRTFNHKGHEGTQRISIGFLGLPSPDGDFRVLGDESSLARRFDADPLNCLKPKGHETTQKLNNYPFVFLRALCG